VSAGVKVAVKVVLPLGSSAAVPGVYAKLPLTGVPVVGSTALASSWALLRAVP
jgi:hypothetical protein